MPSQPFFDLLNGLEQLNDTNKYAAFQIVNAPYKTSPNHGSHIAADVLIPKVLRNADPPGPRPVIVRIHGGFLVTGSSLYPPWFNTWILDYAIKYNAIIVSPNYRLLPEVSGREILEDIHDFWRWLRNGSVDLILEEAGFIGTTLDINAALVVGESAGGYLATQLAISHPSQIRAVIIAYPMIDLRSRFYTESYPKPIVGVPNIPMTVVDTHLAMITSTANHRISWITAASPPNRLELAFAIVQNGRFPEIFGSSRDLYPMERIEDIVAARKNFRLPPMFILHGEDDSAVPVQGSRDFVHFLRRDVPDTQVLLYTQEGDHGFDATTPLEAPWLRSGLEMTTKAWLGSSGAHL